MGGKRQTVETTDFETNARVRVSVPEHYVRKNGALTAHGGVYVKGAFARRRGVPARENPYRAEAAHSMGARGFRNAWQAGYEAGVIEPVAAPASMPLALCTACGVSYLGEEEMNHHNGRECENCGQGTVVRGTFSYTPAG